MHIHSNVVCLILITTSGIATRSCAETDSTDSDTDSHSDSRYTYRDDHDPDGIGKFYMDREIAQVMGFGPTGQGAEWLERETREQEEKLTLLIRSLDLQPRMVVADIGAGSGVISVLMAKQLGDDGRVIAVDIQDAMLARLKKNAEILDISNIVPHRGEVDSPCLPEETVDIAIMVDVYHELEFPWEMMLELSSAIKPGGRVVFVEYRMEDPTVPIKLVHKMTEAQVRREIERPEFSLTWKETIDVLPWQHIIVFERAAEAAESFR